MVLRLAPQNAASLRRNTDIEVVQNSSWAVGRLSLATQTAPLDNPKVRQALTHAIDRQALVKAVLGGVGGAVGDSWVRPRAGSQSVDDTAEEAPFRRYPRHP
ncbi:hypothetical protein GKO32_10300 [Amycolatopsis sp. RM579]|uniref:Solute-binding protein family 5 domain-containing protein n=1 Tax=Amycolatopsis pithecellobii TaxID=664692 RepID=A0A6N7Z2R2_9PSEU|nr:hypothetical protein [Amycolatopsis pithecellobii]